MSGAAPFIVVDRVCKEFRHDARAPLIRVIDELSMDIARGEFVVFLGPSGCGKTTLMRIIGGLETASHGSVLIDGTRVTGPDRRKGMVFQSYSSFPWLDVLDNVRFGLRYRADLGPAEKERLARHYVRLVGLEGFEHYHVNRISGGMRQRLAIARTLAAGPDVLLMDEPFGALDAQNREFLQAQLVEIQRAEHKTVVFVTHDVEEAVFLADRIFVFSARPATVIEVIRVAEHLDGERTLAMKATESFFRLRNRILELTRAQARRVESMWMAAGAEP